MERLLPRHMQIIYLINALHLDAQRDGAGTTTTRFLSSISLIDENHGRRVRMGHLAFVGSHQVNGVSALHTELMRKTVFRDLQRALSRPHRQQDQRHHVPPLALSRPIPDLTELIVDAIGDRALDGRPDALKALAPFADDASLRERFAAVRRDQQGRARARSSPSDSASALDPDAMFDVQVKRIHEYKRQLLNLLETVALYNAIRAEPDARLGAAGQDLRRQGGRELPPGQADHQARQRRRRVVNRDPTVRGLLKVVFLPNYNVSLAEIDHARRRPVRADLDRRHGGLRHRQHEAGAQRRADRSARSTAPMSRSAIGSATTTSSSSA